MSEQIYGYIPHQPNARDIGAQKLALQAFGVPEGNLYIDRVGEHAEEPAKRPAFQRLLAALCPGDTLAVNTISHLGQNYGEILDQWRYIAEEKHTAIVVLDMPFLDTRSDQAVTGTQLSALVLQLLTRIAHVEYAFFRQRQAKGVAEARSRGVKFGRPRLVRPSSYALFCEAWKQGNISARSAAKFLGVDHHTFLRWTKAEKPVP